MKKIILFLLIIFSIQVLGQTQPQTIKRTLWNLTNNRLNPISSTWGINIPTGKAYCIGDSQIVRLSAGQVQFNLNGTWTAIPSSITGVGGWTRTGTVLGSTTAGDSVKPDNLLGKVNGKYDFLLISIVQVGSQRLHTTIAAGIAAATAGSIVMVDPGTYNITNITVPTGVYLMGLGNVILNVTSGYGFVATSITATFDNLTITGGSFLNAKGSSFVTLNRVTIGNNLVFSPQIATPLRIENTATVTTHNCELLSAGTLAAPLLIKNKARLEWNGDRFYTNGIKMLDTSYVNINIKYGYSSGLTGNLIQLGTRNPLDSVNVGADGAWKYTLPTAWYDSNKVQQPTLYLKATNWDVGTSLNYATIKCYRKSNLYIDNTFFNNYLYAVSAVEQSMVRINNSRLARVEASDARPTIYGTRVYLKSTHLYYDRDDTWQPGSHCLEFSLDWNSGIMPYLEMDNCSVKYMGDSGAVRNRGNPTAFYKVTVNANNCHFLRYKNYYSSPNPVVIAYNNLMSANWGSKFNGCTFENKGDLSGVYGVNFGTLADTALNSSVSYNNCNIVGDGIDYGLYISGSARTIWRPTNIKDQVCFDFKMNCTTPIYNGATNCITPSVLLNSPVYSHSREIRSGGEIWGKTFINDSYKFTPALASGVAAIDTIRDYMADIKRISIPLARYDSTTIVLSFSRPQIHVEDPTNCINVTLYIQTQSNYSFHNGSRYQIDLWAVNGDSAMAWETYYFTKTTLFNKTYGGYVQPTITLLSITNTAITIKIKDGGGYGGGTLFKVEAYNAKNIKTLTVN
jgi:hypothetical protein